MTEDRIHRAVSADGTEIAGRVHGQGPPLVLVHGGLGDGDLNWEALVPHLTDRFTCYLPSYRGRGLSSEASDYAPPRGVEDVVAFVDSIGEPASLVGWSYGGMLVLGVAAHSASVVSVAAFEPFVPAVLREDDFARFGATIEQMAEAAADGRLVDAARAFFPLVATDNEIAAMETDHFERYAASIPVVLEGVQQLMAYEGPQPTDPEVLGQITVPVLLLRGQESVFGGSTTVFADAEQHVAEHVADPHVREPLPGVGHMAPLVAPEPIAQELISFLESVRRAEPA